MIMTDKENKDKMENNKRDKLFGPVSIIAFITALFYVCTYGYHHAYFTRLGIPVDISELSFASPLPFGNMAAQLFLISFIIVFPAILIYTNYKTNKINITLRIIFISYLILLGLKFFLSEFMIWFKDNMFNAFILAFICYSIIIILILANYSKLDEIKNSIDGIVKQLTHQHIILILVVIILVVMTFCSYLGDFNAEKMLNGPRIQMHIVPKDQNISILDQPLFFVRYANGNYYLSENNRSDGGRKSEIYIIPNSEIKMITMNEIKEATAQPKRTVP